MVLHWDDDASRFVEERWLSTEPRRRDAEEIAAETLPVLSGLDGAVLDAGCGPGYWLDRFSDLRNLVLFGTDLSLKRLRLCSGSPVVAGDLCRLPFGNESFGAILLIHVLEYIEDVDAVWSELWRVLKPNGIVLVCTKNPGGLPWRAALAVSQLFAACPHVPLLRAPDALCSAWPGEMVWLRYLRPRLVTDLQDVNDAVKLRAPHWVDRGVSAFFSRMPSWTRSFLAWHYIMLLRKS